MIKNIEKLICVLLLLYGNSASAGVDCSGSPHTRLEIAICGEPVLRSIDQELTDALSRAQQRGIIDRATAREQRNQIARQCWREVDETLNSCLHNAELNVLEWVAVKLGEVAEEDHGLSNRIGEGLVHQNLMLQKQLVLAERRLRRTGNPDLTIETIFELIRINDRQHQLQLHDGGASDASHAIAQLEQRLASGCNHTVYGKKWRRMLDRRDMSCTRLHGREVPALYSSSEFH